MRHELPLSVLMLDVDHFKRINDTHGHLAGDKVLQALAATLKEDMREADLLARSGGEEFIVALPHTVAREAEQVAERIRSRVMKCSIACGDQAVRVTVSVGVSQQLPGEPTIEPAIKRADGALYLAKGAGRNCVMAQLSAIAP